MGSFPATLDGLGTGVPGAWTNTVAQSFSLSIFGLGYAGIVVDFIPPLVLATDRAIILDPPTFLSFDIVITAFANNPAFTYNLRVVSTPDPGDFAVGNAPVDYINSGDVFEVVMGGASAGVAAGGELVIPVDLDDLFPVYRQSTWDGKINCIFEAQRVVGPINPTRWNSYLNPVPTRYSTTEIAFVAGLSGYDVHAQSRVDRCDRCGSYDLRERFTDDGYSKGLSVCGDCWDPEDPPTRPIPPDLPPIND